MQKQGHSLKALLYAALLVLSLCGCTKEKVEPRPVAAPLPRSFKEYELYSWRSGGTWQFTLITGTNRLKTLDEITSPENVEQGEWVKITAAGVPELESLLGRLPSGTQISWHSVRHLEPSSLASRPVIRRPPGRLFRQVRAHCAALGLTLDKGR